MSGTLTIHQAGPAMTIQDLGRPGYRAVGLTHGGAADPTALHEGAALLGQDPNSAALEMAGRVAGRRTQFLECRGACLEQFERADNMTERLTALAVLVNSPFEAERDKALQAFAEHFKDNPLVMDQWFSVQAGSPLPGGLERVQQLMNHPAFTLKNPNKVRALIGAFAPGLGACVRPRLRGAFEPVG